ncbi:MULTISPECIES: MBL fold metallo-hydrolase [unclassified Ruminococcus]|uniref:MBL fold metallo-hydrolase n=1 Tax=unclassified Ruminococcus TaxID=2608920 RepID=UPI00210BEE54|nr:MULTISPECIES: MBL fold metallo-hydrolase [unclassified Ruminococcus]MCQ4022266.1 MBL fold metallo-hydrolase [Ruminococcus sp. zg-924]MCQ4114594.1 MBL fold metallo-hydrolase [Ruminococcus sp. zg-921]
MLKVERYEVGALATNCYILTDEKSGDCAIVDPGEKSKALIAAIDAIQPEKLKFILITHGHFDHIGYVGETYKKTNAQVVIGEKDMCFLSRPDFNLSASVRKEISYDMPVKSVSQDDVITLGNTEIKVIELPGHTRGGVGYLADGMLFCGDTLFKGSMGRTDFPTGSEQQLLCSLKKLSALPDNTVVHCGHGEDTLIGEEKRRNYCMKYAMENC